MKEHVLQILKLKDEGKLTTDQAAELLAALVDGENGAASGPVAPGAAKAAGGGEEGWSGFARDMGAIGQRVTQVIGEAVRQRDKAGNTTTLSHVDVPEGTEFAFHDNSINVAQVLRLKLNRARVVNNYINASRVADLVVTDGAVENCKINGSSLDELRVEGGTMAESAFHGSKCVRLRLETGCQWTGSECSGMSIKDVTLRGGTGGAGGAKIAGNTWRGASVTGVDFSNGSTLDDVSLAGLSLSDSHFDAASWKDVTVRAMKMAGVTVLRSSFVHVLVEGKLTRQSTIENTRFEDCKLKDCRLVGCSFTDCVIKGVELEGVRAEGAEVRGVTIQGAEEFRRALRIG